MKSKAALKLKVSAPTNLPNLFNEVHEDFEKLLDRLGGYIEDATSEKFKPVDRKRLENLVHDLQYSYECDQCTIDQLSARTLHELRKLVHDVDVEWISKAYDLINHERNWPEVFAALGAPVESFSPHFAEFEEASEKHDSILRDLSELLKGNQSILCRLRSIAQSSVPPVRRKRHRPQKPKNLQEVAEALARFWTDVTRQKFKQDWSKKAAAGRDAGRKRPLTDAAWFVVDIATYIAPNRYGELPSITARIAHTLRK